MQFFIFKFTRLFTVSDAEKDRCYYTNLPAGTPGEACDDVDAAGNSINGMYGTISVGGHTVSRCKTDCSGRIGVTASDSDGNYFCGDGLVQYKNGTSCAGDNCSKVTESNYHGVEIGAFTASEKCDPAANDSPQTICEQALGTGRTYYPQNAANYTVSGAKIPSCGTDCQSFNKADKNTGCNYCGDGELGGNETCEVGQTTAQLCQSVEKEYKGTPGSKIWDFESSSIPYGRPPEITEEINYYYSVNYGSDQCQNTIYFDYQNNTSHARRCYSAQTLTPTAKGWDRTTEGSHNTYCSATKGLANTMAELKLKIRTSTSGTISFNYYGGSEGTAHCSGGYATNKFDDGALIYFDKTPTTGTNGGQNADLMITGNCQSWTSFSKTVDAGDHTIIFRYFKDSGTNSNIDKFCIDDISFQGIVPATSSTTNPSNISCDSSCNKTGTCYNWCGDGTKQSDYEFCDNGESNTDEHGTSGRCNKTCSGWAPYCGDGIINGSESCDSDAGVRIGWCYTTTSDWDDCDEKYYTHYHPWYAVCSGCKRVKDPADTQEVSYSSYNDMINNIGVSSMSLCQ